MTKVFIPLMGLALMVLVIAISLHATTRTEPGAMSALEIYDLLKRAGDGNDDGTCKQLVVASCPNCVDAQSGKPSPHFKIACRLNGTSMNNGQFVVGIVGTRYPDNPVYVTGYPMEGARLQKVIIRDGCKFANWEIVRRLLR